MSVIPAKNNNTVAFDEQAVLEEIRDTVLSADGVSRFASGIADNLAGMLGRDTMSGMKIDSNGSNIDISLNIIALFGINIPQLAYDIQSKVKKNTEEMTGLTVTSVNITIEGLDRNSNE